ncbi:hypothetical protein GBA65_05055 [Rubrobacter marinus]|uniref:Branched-chain amino acid transport n=1 Tax=Rubrobacter marinus TaxID=2653852 RepID=A0A6G8PU73_9ACTN|nr:AzlD domain-containing protein [Rubrobacter marinus]QIN77990.1 hypothetical protein GBA65_05055 [Rubrobacter marinus]
MSPGLLLLLFLVVGAGNYLMRFLPLLIALRRRERPGQETATTGGLLPLVGPAVVVALLITSLLPGDFAPGYGAELARGAVALVPTVLVALRFGNLGLTVLTGVFAYALVALVA